MSLADDVAKLENDYRELSQYNNRLAIRQAHWDTLVSALKRIKAIQGSTGGPEAVANEMRTIADFALAHAGEE